MELPAEVITASQLAGLFWASVVIVIVIAGQWWQVAHDFGEKMLRQWKPALVIALLSLFSTAIGGMGFAAFSSITRFCQAMIGLALAYSIAGFEPLPVTQAVVRREAWMEQIWIMLGTSIAVVMAAFLVNGPLWSILVAVFGETSSNPEGYSSFFPNAWQSFFLLLAGAGIAEETTYRLLGLSFLWRLTRRPWLSIILSAILFGAYHLCPLDAFYLQYWERPITVFTMSAVMGVVMGYIYLKRGYETAVLGHTLGDWVMLLFARAA